MNYEAWIRQLTEQKERELDAKMESMEDRVDQHLRRQPGVSRDDRDWHLSEGLAQWREDERAKMEDELRAEIHEEFVKRGLERGMEVCENARRDAERVSEANSMFRVRAEDEPEEASSTVTVDVSGPTPEMFEDQARETSAAEQDEPGESSSMDLEARVADWGSFDSFEW